ncbi:hypothetical protein NCCP28_32490 [Niallia sp. NCCP-28]|nr:hypothetical protein NCCP28_32490 [Niallia sp. NCCP-28]
MKQEISTGEKSIQIRGYMLDPFGIYSLAGIWCSIVIGLFATASVEGNEYAGNKRNMFNQGRLS